MVDDIESKKSEDGENGRWTLRACIVCDIDQIKGIIGYTKREYKSGETRKIKSIKVSVETENALIVVYSTIVNDTLEKMAKSYRLKVNNKIFKCKYEEG